ncbi:uncharacterized protein N7459_004305 [Penicillium hispanicum]|uniref:uncharacterized protein n=1 Tax=Penicillium hispanicum TaxID=1080232 RepID=UPI002541D030|nr:uncharacterized protein N7459_004305 [Penicillium hispanicum]KAJ5584505.1 hypothetical protein N7459_004305 [Penicillium hispanicum]
MWSKGPFNRRRRSIDHPTSVDKTSENPSVSADPARADMYTKELPALPKYVLSHDDPESPTQPAAPVAVGDNYDPAEKRYSAVSPIESPLLGAYDSDSSFCVSPIEETEHSPRHEFKDSSQDSEIVPHEPPAAAAFEPSQRTQKAVQFVRSSEQPTRWDDFSGEPTTNAAAKAGQVAPRDTTFHKVPGSHASNFLNWGREQLQPKKRLTQARIRITGSSKNEVSAQKDPRGRSSSRVHQLGEHSGNRSHSRDASPHVNNLGFVPTVVTTITAGNTKPLPERPASEHAYVKPGHEQPETTQPAETKFHAAIASMMRQEQPLSRLGAQDSTTRTESPGESPNDSPRDSLNFGSKSTDDLHSSIMARRRPIPLSMPTSKKPVRKPTPSEASQEPAMAAQPPPEQPPQDAASRIRAQEARRDELARRRVNLETVIQELTRVIQPTSIAYDLAAKAEVKKTVQSIENEVAEIKREEHELGLKITRAWRRLDEKENNGDGSNLWVKRVTS